MTSPPATAVYRSPLQTSILLVVIQYAVAGLLRTLTKRCRPSVISHQPRGTYSLHFACLSAQYAPHCGLAYDLSRDRPWLVGRHAQLGLSISVPVTKLLQGRWDGIRRLLLSFCAHSRRAAVGPRVFFTRTIVYCDVTCFQSYRTRMKSDSYLWQEAFLFYWPISSQCWV